MLHSQTFLVVDDDARLRAVVAEVLERLGCEVHRAATGYEALEVARRLPVDTAFLDVQMPGIDGFETARRLRQVRAETQVVFVSGSGSEDTRRRSREVGAFAWIDKPVGRADLENVARRLNRRWRPHGPPDDRFLA